MRVKAEREGHIELEKPDTELLGKMLYKLRRGGDSYGHKLADIMERAAVNPHFRLLQPVNGKVGAILQHRRILSEKMRNCLIMDAGARQCYSS